MRVPQAPVLHRWSSILIVVALLLLAAAGGANAAVVTDTLQAGLNPNWWSITQSGPEFYSTTSSAGVTLTESGTNTLGNWQGITLQANLANMLQGASITGDFQLQSDFSNLSLPTPPSGNYWNEAWLHVGFADGTALTVMRFSASSGQYVEGFSTLPVGSVANGLTAGTFSIARTGSTVNLYIGSTLVAGMSGYSAAVSAITMQLWQDTANPSTVTWSNFSLSVPGLQLPEPSALSLLILALPLGFCRRRSSS